MEDKTELNKKISKIRRQLAKNYAEQKRLMESLNELLGNENVSSKFDIDNYEPSKIKIPPKLKEFFDTTQKYMTHSEIRTLLYEYIDENELCNKKTRQIKLNKELRNLFSLTKKDTLDFYSLQEKLCELLG